MESFDVIVIGAGAAGLMGAIAAGRRGRRVLALERAEKPGKKILISGGGRCNFTNLHTAPDRFLSNNPHFCKSALARFTQRDVVALVERHGIAYHEKTLGQLFCDGSARAIVAMLLEEGAAVGVSLRAGLDVTDVTRSDHFRIETSGGSFMAPSLVLATGGLSIPRMGATDFTHHVARRFGLAVTATRPALVPLTFVGEDLNLMRSLSGVSLDVVACSERARFREAMLFTHRGLSGPAILQVSSTWREGEPVTIDLLPDHDTRFLVERKKARPRVLPATALAEAMPERLAQIMAERHLPVRPLADLPDRDLIRCMEALKAWRLVPSGTEGYAKAEVTLGGVSTADLSSRTMAARGVPGLFIVGEAVDVTGWLGGYNFQWAWSSGWTAGQEA
ncbi:MAG: NAD(P)/FAD-dependent oxidoreductase [Alphaproteobacteria bacterium]|nr:NAD(P)/FAD-dependent oxidoreductase [Alphaproteobacteria bacterium]